jgi:hypothetical protein
MGRALRASSSASSASLPYSFGTTQKNQSKSRTNISGRVFPAYLPNGTVLQRISALSMLFASEDDPERFGSPEFVAKIPGEANFELVD